MPRSQLRSDEPAYALGGKQASAAAKPTATVVGRNKLSCRQLGDRMAIFKGASKIPAAVIIPDERYPGMFRVIAAGQSPSDMVNLTRAVDAAFVSVLRHENKPAEQEKPGEGSPSSKQL
jgi:hypothetical protein